MTTVCFLLPGPSACRGHQRLGGGAVIGLLAVKGLGDRHGGGGGAPCGQYLSSPPARSFCSVELGPQVRPFFLPPTSSSFFGGPLLRPHVPPPPLLLQLVLQPPPSTGVTGPREATWSLGLSLSQLISSLTLPALVSPATWKPKGAGILTPVMTLPCYPSSHSSPQLSWCPGFLGVITGHPSPVNSSTIPSFPNVH